MLKSVSQKQGRSGAWLPISGAFESGRVVQAPLATTIPLPLAPKAARAFEKCVRLPDVGKGRSQGHWKRWRLDSRHEHQPEQIR
jgi:hypothetical protein